MVQSTDRKMHAKSPLGKSTLDSDHSVRFITPCNTHVLLGTPKKRLSRLECSDRVFKHVIEIINQWSATGDPYIKCLEFKETSIALH